MFDSKKSESASSEESVIADEVHVKPVSYVYDAYQERLNQWIRELRRGFGIDFRAQEIEQEIWLGAGDDDEYHGAGAVRRAIRWRRKL